MDELLKEDELMEESGSENPKFKKPGEHINILVRKPKPFILANLNRSMGKGMNATHQTKLRPTKKKKR